MDLLFLGDVQQTKKYNVKEEIKEKKYSRQNVWVQIKSIIFLATIRKILVFYFGNIFNFLLIKI